MPTDKPVFKPSKNLISVFNIIEIIQYNKAQPSSDRVAYS